MSNRILVAAIICALAGALACSYWAHAGTRAWEWPIRGVITYYPDKSYNGYTLYAGMHSTNLIDMNGNIVHTWPKAPVLQPPLQNGEFITRVMQQEERGPYGRVDNILRKELVAYDWDGNIVWSYKADRVLHHDYYVTANGNILMLYWEDVPEEYKAKIEDESRRNAAIVSDGIVEVTPDGKVVWEWHAYEHLDINQYCPVCPVGDWTHTNTVQELPETALGKRDPRFKAGNILINPRNLDTIFIIDKESGEVVWSWGTDVLRHSHQPTMLESGNIILFDNGVHRRPAGFSRVLEVNPSTGEIVWEYSEGAWFFSPTVSGVQRLPNGNTLICSGSGRRARLFEVTPEKEIVWEFIPRHEESVYRAFRIPYDHSPQTAALPRPKEEPVIAGVPYLPGHGTTDESPLPPGAAVAGDINSDGLVDRLDLARLVTGYGSEIGQQRYEASSDLNGDKVIDYLDLAVLGGNYGRKAEYTD